MKLGRCLIILGGVILLIGGLLHTYAYKFVEPKFAAALAADPHLLGVFKAMWWAFAVEFVMLGLIVLWASRLPVCRIVLLRYAVIRGLTSLLMFHYMAPFVG